MCGGEERFVCAVCVCGCVCGGGGVSGGRVSCVCGGECVVGGSHVCVGRRGLGVWGQGSVWGGEVWVCVGWLKITVHVITETY